MRTGRWTIDGESKANTKPAQAFVMEGTMPVKTLCGSPGYINLLKALNACALVHEIVQATSLPAAASFKHVSPCRRSHRPPPQTSLHPTVLCRRLRRG
ncbi:unnamed protein product [Tilletia caries]|nr:hypothetical protein CF336_g9278 [Tilletia laevis]CAD6896885.1 unnamed protein product [Tilletia caries]